MEVEATFPDGSSLTLHLRAGELSVAGAHYDVREAGALHHLIDRLRIPGEALAGAVTRAESVRLVIADLPAVERSLRRAPPPGDRVAAPA